MALGFLQMQNSNSSTNDVASTFFRQVSSRTYSCHVTRWLQVFSFLNSVNKKIIEDYGDDNKKTVLMNLVSVSSSV